MDKMKKFRYKWFYFIDHKGLLYTGKVNGCYTFIIEDTKIRNYTTWLKQKKALNFFFEHLQPNDLGIEEDYPYISPCWTEMNFVKWYEYPIVFSNLYKNANNKLEISYGGDHIQEFDPSRLKMDGNGHFLHPLDNHKYLKHGSFDTSLSISFGEKVREEDDQFFIEWEKEK